MKPKASFVIPAFNASAFLAPAILSCREQTVKEIEIIVVDDGSDDGTSDLVEWHSKQDARVKLLKFKKNEGRSAARNAGNDLAKGSIIFVLDADDIANKSRVRDTLITFQMKNPDVVYGPFQVMDEQNNVIGNQSAGPINREISIKRQQNFIGHSTMAYRKGVTANVRYDEDEFSRLGLDDWKFQWDCILKGYKFEVCKQILSKYRIYQLPNQTYGSPTEFYRNPEEVKKAKDEYLAGIENKLSAKS